MKLYTLPGSCSLAPHIMMKEMGIQGEVIVAKKNTPQWDETKKLSISGQVPVIETNEGYGLTEGAAIMQYFVSLKPDGNFFPKEGRDHFKAHEWMSFIATTLHKGFNPVMFPQNFTENLDQTDGVKKKAISKLKDHFQSVEARLDRKPFVFGDQMTVVDAYLFVVSTWAKKQGIEFSDLPKLNAFMTAMYQRPSVVEAMKAEGLLR